MDGKNLLNISVNPKLFMPDSTIKDIIIYPFFQISNVVNGINCVMVNSHCRTKELPFCNDCDCNKRWKILDFDNKKLTDDESLTFDCKN